MKGEKRDQNPNHPLFFGGAEEGEESHLPTSRPLNSSEEKRKSKMWITFSAIDYCTNSSPSRPCFPCYSSQRSSLPHPFCSSLFEHHETKQENTHKIPSISFVEEMEATHRALPTVSLKKEKTELGAIPRMLNGPRWGNSGTPNPLRWAETFTILHF